MKKKKQKPPLTSEQIYKANRRKSKLFNRLSPVVYWLFLALAVVFLCLTVRNSIGNIIEITTLLDSDTHTGEEIAENYKKLVEKYGEWTIVGGEDGSTITIRFVDVRKALFGGLALTFGVLMIACLVVAVVVGKFAFKQIAKMYTESNDVMVDMATLRTLEAVGGNADEKKGKKNKNKEWF